MSDHFLSYLERELVRLDQLVAAYLEGPARNDLDVARLKRARLVAEKQLHAWRAETRARASA
jgi:hypothetical protein